MGIPVNGLILFTFDQWLIMKSYTFKKYTVILFLLVFFNLLHYFMEHYLDPFEKAISVYAP